MLDFLHEISEARLFKNKDTLYGKSAEELATFAYLMIMMLEILRNTDKDYAKKYAINCLAYENFDGMRANASDLHNVLAVLNHQDKYEGKLTPNANISVPALQIKRYLRDIENGRKEPSTDRQLFMTVETYFKLKDSRLKQMRRDVGDWHLNSDAEKATIQKTIKNYMSTMTLSSDIFAHFKSSNL